LVGKILKGIGRKKAAGGGGGEGQSLLEDDWGLSRALNRKVEVRRRESQVKIRMFLTTKPG